jgi:hypothetical protein
MKKIWFTMIGVFVISCLLTVEASAATTKEINDAFKEVLGRNPTPTDLSEWGKSGASKAQIVDGLKNFLTQPAGQTELRNMIEQTYIYSFGRKPKPEELDYWVQEIAGKKKKFGAYDLVNFQRQYLKSPENDPERRLAIMNAYLHSLGRFPEQGDIDFWMKQMLANGSTFFDISQAGSQWILGSGGDQQKEMHETALRAFGYAKVSNPNEMQIQAVIDQYKKFVKEMSGLYSKQVRVNFWYMVMTAGWVANKKYPEPTGIPPVIATLSCGLCSSSN